MGTALYTDIINSSYFFCRIHRNARVKTQTFIEPVVWVFLRAEGSAGMSEKRLI